MTGSHGTVLVTGATGFIGRHLCRHLLDRGFEVRAAMRSGRTGEFAPGVECIEVGDVGPLTNWREALEGVSYVAHLAGLAHQIDPRQKSGEAEYVRINAQGTAQLGRSAAETPGLKRMIFVSSIAVFGRSSTTVAANSPCEPADPYGRSKLEGERALARVLHDSPVDWCVLRPPLVYGPGNPGNMARLATLTRLPLPLPLKSIANERSFIFVGNLTDAIVLCLTEPRASRQVFTVADRERLSTPELVQKVASAAGRRVRLLPFPTWALRAIAQGGDIVAAVTGRSPGLDSYAVDRLLQTLTVDTEDIRGRIGWEPPFSLDEGLHETFRSVEAAP